jgi:hypothetical protein
MRFVLMSTLAAAVGCAEQGGHDWVDLGPGAPPVRMEIGHQSTPLGVPACRVGLHDTRQCAGGEHSRNWLAYQDGSGLGCLADGVGTHHINEAGPLQRWGVYEFCAPGSVKDEAPGCECEQNARCTIPSPPLADSSMVVVYGAREAAGIPDWARAGAVLITQRVGPDNGAALCLSAGDQYPLAVVRFDPTTLEAMERECYDPLTGEPDGCLNLTAFSR